jgi:hypothetical protein
LQSAERKVVEHFIPSNPACIVLTEVSVAKLGQQHDISNWYFWTPAAGASIRRRGVVFERRAEQSHIYFLSQIFGERRKLGVIKEESRPER